MKTYKEYLEEQAFSLDNIPKVVGAHGYRPVNNNTYSLGKNKITVTPDGRWVYSDGKNNKNGYGSLELNRHLNRNSFSLI